MNSLPKCHGSMYAGMRLSPRLKIVGGIFLLVFGLSFLPVFAALNQSLLSYLKIVWWAVLLGF